MSKSTGSPTNKGKELTKPVQQEIQKFREYLETQTDSEDTIKNYVSSVKRYYRLNKLDRPINPSRFVYLEDKEEMREQEGTDREVEVGLHRDYDELFKSLDTTITSRSMKYGVKKYYEYLKSQSSRRLTRLNLSEILEKLGNLEIHQEDNNNDKYLTQGKVKQFMAEAEEKDPEFGTLLRMMYETGARASGMTNIQWRDVEMEQRDGKDLEKTDVFLSKTRTKGKVNGIVYITEETYNQLQELKENREPEPKDVVFYPDMTRGSLYNKIWRHFEDTDASPHSFRYTRLIDLGIKLHEREGLSYESLLGKVSKYARHKDTDTTKIYVEKVEDIIEDGSSKIKKYINEDLKTEGEVQ